MKQLRSVKRLFDTYHSYVLFALLVIVFGGTMSVLSHFEAEIASHYDEINQTLDSIPSPSNEGVTAGAQTETPPPPPPDNQAVEPEPEPALSSKTTSRQPAQPNRNVASAQTTTPQAAQPQTSPPQNNPPTNQPPKAEPESEPEPEPQPLFCLLGLCFL